jgi:hypothetical protein
MWRSRDRSWPTRTAEGGPSHVTLTGQGGMTIAARGRAMRPARRAYIYVCRVDGQTNINRRPGLPDSTNGRIGDMAITSLQHGVACRSRLKRNRYLGQEADLPTS